MGYPVIAHLTTPLPLLAGVGCRHVRGHTQLFMWALGIWTQAHTLMQ